MTISAPVPFLFFLKKEEAMHGDFLLNCQAKKKKSQNTLCKMKDIVWKKKPWDMGGGEKRRKQANSDINS